MGTEWEWACRGIWEGLLRNVAFPGDLEHETVCTIDAEWEDILMEDRIDASLETARR